jgi:superfamily II DNA helicase RecQ
MYPVADGALNDLLYRRLVAWRDHTARAMGVPGYTVVSDAVLRRIVESGPRDRAELSRVWGMGPRRLMAFGDEILSLCSTRSSLLFMPEDG